MERAPSHESIAGTFHGLARVRLRSATPAIAVCLLTFMGVQYAYGAEGDHPSAASASETQAALHAIAQPDLDALAPQVRDSIARAQDYFERTRPRLTPAQLGHAYGRLGMVYHAWEFQAAARAAYLNAVALVPSDPHWPYYLAVHFEETGDLDKAMAYYRRSLALAPDYTNGWLRLGTVALEAGLLVEADSAFRETLARAPDSAAALAGLGDLAARRRAYREAVEYYGQALRRQPEATQLHYRLALVYRHLGELDKAHEHLALRGERIASSVDPWIEVMKARAKGAAYFVRLAREALAAGDLAKTAGALKLALSIDPEDAAAYTAYAALLVQAGRADEALRYLEQALRISPRDADALELMRKLQASNH